MEIIADTDELDDADLGINVDPKEYHLQKSKMRSLQQRLDSIKNDINKETDINIKELKKIAKNLNDENRKRYPDDNLGDKWLGYKGNVTEKVLLDAFRNGYCCGWGCVGDDYYEEIEGNIRIIERAVNKFKSSELFDTYSKLLSGKSITVYRGLHFYDISENIYKYLKYNLMDRNSWTTSFKIAKQYAKDAYGYTPLVLRMDCSVDDANLPLSAWLSGYWGLENKEINLKKSFKVKNISVCWYEGLNKSIIPKSLLNNNVESMFKPYNYKGNIITASSKKEAIHKIIALSKDRLSEGVKKAYDELNERFCDYHGKIYTKELIESIRLAIDNNPVLYNQIKNKRYKIHSVVWYALEEVFNKHLEWAECRKLSSEQIKNWFAYNNTDYKTALKKVSDDIEKMRKEYIEEGL